MSEDTRASRREMRRPRSRSLRTGAPARPEVPVLPEAPEPPEAPPAPEAVREPEEITLSRAEVRARQRTSGKRVLAWRASMPRGGAENHYVVWVLAVAMLVLGLTRSRLRTLLDEHDAVQAWMTVFVSIALQALPFLVLGVVLSAALAAWVPPERFTRLLPSSPALAVPVAGVSGVALPGCECASVPVAGTLVSKGIRPAVALTFLLAAPAINPIVLASTAVAFAGEWKVVAARFLASLATAIIVGWIWLRLGKDRLIRMPSRPAPDSNRLAHFVDEARHDVLHAGGYLVVGAAVAATVKVLVPRTWIDTLAGNLLIAVIVLAIFAVIVAVCSEADAFVAASLTAFPMTARLAFMVVGPAVDVKLVAMQVGTFGKRFAMTFAPLTFAVAVIVATVTGVVLL